MPRTERLTNKIVDHAVKHGSGRNTLRCLALASRNSPFDPKSWGINTATKLGAYEVNTAYVGLPAG